MGLIIFTCPLFRPGPAECPDERGLAGGETEVECKAARRSREQLRI